MFEKHRANALKISHLTCVNSIRLFQTISAKELKQFLASETPLPAVILGTKTLKRTFFQTPSQERCSALIGPDHLDDLAWARNKDHKVFAGLNINTKQAAAISESLS